MEAWKGGVDLADGFYIINEFTNTLPYFIISIGRATPNRDISLGSGVTWSGGFGLDDGFYIIIDTSDTARFYNLDRTRDPTTET